MTSSLLQMFIGHMPRPWGSLLVWQVETAVLAAVLLALLTRTVRARRRRTRAVTAPVSVEAEALKQRLRATLAESQCLFSDPARAGPVSGVTEGFERDLAAAREVLSAVGGRRSAAKELLRRSLHNALEARADGCCGSAKAAVCWRQLGVLALLDDTSDALRAYANAAELAPEDAEAQMLAGVLYLRAGNLPLAEAAFRRQIAVGDNGGARLWLYRGLTLLGDVHAARKAYAEAIASYKEAQREAQALTDKTPDQASFRRDLSVAFDRLGDAFAQQGALDAALANYRRALDIVTALAGCEPDHALWLRDQSVSYDRIGDVLARQGDLQGALQSFEQGLQLAQRLGAHDPGNAQWQWDLSTSHDRIGDVQLAMGNSEAALQSYRRALAIAELLAAADGNNIAWRRDLAVSYHKAGSLEAERHNPAEARDLLQKGRAIIARLERIAAYHTQWRADLAKFDRELQALSG